MREPKMNPPKPNFHVKKDWSNYYEKIIDWNPFESFFYLFIGYILLMIIFGIPIALLQIVINKNLSFMIEFFTYFLGFIIIIAYILQIIFYFYYSKEREEREKIKKKQELLKIELEEKKIKSEKERVELEKRKEEHRKELTRKKEIEKQLSSLNNKIELLENFAGKYIQAKVERTLINTFSLNEYDDDDPKLKKIPEKEVSNSKDNEGNYVVETNLFVRTYSPYNLNYHINTEQFRLLKKLLEKDEVQLKSEDLEMYIVDIYKKKIKNEFMNKISQISSKTEILEFFVENYYHKSEYYEPLADYLKINIDSLRLQLDKTKENIKLKQFEKKLKDKNSKLYSIQDVDQMSGYDFERFLKELFEKMNYSVKHTSLSGDQGADLVVEKLNVKSVIQAKRFNKPVGNKAVQEVVAARNHYDCDKAIVVSNNTYTPSAKTLAKSNGVELWDRSKLTELISDFF